MGKYDCAIQRLTASAKNYESMAADTDWALRKTDCIEAAENCYAAIAKLSEPEASAAKAQLLKSIVEMTETQKKESELTCHVGTFALAIRTVDGKRRWTAITDTGEMSPEQFVKQLQDEDFTQQEPHHDATPPENS